MHRPGFSVIGLSAFIAALSVPMIAQRGRTQGASAGYEPPSYHDGKPHYEQKETAFGSFTVVRSIEDYRDVPVLHGPWLTKEAKLSWRDSTGAIGFTFIDSGWDVRFSVQATSSDGQTTCLIPGALVGYDPKPSALGHWQKLQPFIRQSIGGCTAVAPADVNRVMAEMELSGADYVSAVNYWKSVSAELFGPNGRRCIAERMMKPFTMPPRYECTKYSAPKARSTAATGVLL